MATGNSIVFFYITERGRRLAETLGRHYPDAARKRFSTGAVRQSWAKGGRLVFIMAAGIVVRAIAPLLTDKRTDPAVVVLDELGAHVVSLLSGHVGGANALAGEIARLMRRQRQSSPPQPTWPAFPASTFGLKARTSPSRTGSAFQGPGRNWWIKRRSRSSRTSPWMLPEVFLPTEDPAHADVVVTNKEGQAQADALLLRPKNLVVRHRMQQGHFRR